MLPPSIAERPRTFEPTEPDLLQVSDTIYIARGGYGVSSSVMVRTDEGRVIVNCWRAEGGQRLREKYDAVDPSPIRYLIFTQGHGDHFGGAAAFTGGSCEVIGHAEQLRSGVDWQLFAKLKSRRLLAWMPPHGWFPPVSRSNLAASIPDVDIHVDDEWSTTVGGREIRIFAMPGAESNEELIVWIPDEKTLIAGNLFGAIFGNIPNLQTLRGDRIRDPQLILDSFDRVLELAPDVLVVGHHGPIVGADAVRESVTRVRDGLQYVHDATVAGLEAGLPVHQLMREIQPPDDLQVLETYGTVRWAVRAIATHYLGWFEGISTLELYGTDPQDLHADLIALAPSVDSVLARANELLAADQALRALQLVEAVIRSGNKNDDAMALYVACHEHLLDDGHEPNLWLDPWLRYQAAEAAKGTLPT
ncbi:MAG: MBL fold metallo-hydrolase [Nocardiaceae bacterium]|nr:MBL fold metallo-hydrolase [Nocardiaceae bacterium]